MVIIGAVLTIIGFALMLGASEASDSDDAAFEMVEGIGLVLSVGGIGLMVIAGIGGAFRVTVEVSKKSTLAGIALIFLIAIVSGVVVLMLLP